MTSDQSTLSSVDNAFFTAELQAYLGRSSLIERTEAIFWIAAVAVLIMDITITYYGLQRGFAELNPIAAYTIDLYGYTTMFWLKIFAVMIGIFGRQLLPKQWRLSVPLVLALPWTIVVFLNIKLIIF